MRNVWKDEEIEIIKNNYQNKTDKEISDLLKTRSSSAVKSKRQELGLEKDKSHRKYTFDDVIKAFNQTDYILLSDEDDYINAAENTLRYLCPRHLDKGELFISLGHLLDGRGCYYCGREVTEEAHRKPKDLLEEECRQLCLSKGFVYCGYGYRNKKITIYYICPKHKEAGIQFMTKGNMNRSNIVGCPFCMDTKKYKFSKGEQEIERVLTENNITYIRQYRFHDCIDIHCLPFDFYLPDLNKCIEFDGQHHFKPVTFNGISQEQAEINHQLTRWHDEIKDNYCRDNHIGLLRIPYNEYQNIQQYIIEFIYDRKEIA